MATKLYFALLLVFCFSLPLVFHFAGQGDAPPTDEVYFENIGPMQCRGFTCMPQFVTICLRTSHQCRFVNDVWHHIDLVHVCQDPLAPGQVVFYSRADKFCQSKV